MTLKTNWNNVCSQYAQSNFYFYLSPSHYCFKPILSYIKKYAQGECLDLGAGNLTYKKHLSTVVDHYVALDKFATHKEIDVIADARDLPFEDNHFDTIFCSQVLEHIKSPEKAFSEMARCLKPGGKLILTAPHLSYLHGEPQDYYRFTPYSLKYLCENNHLQVLEVNSIGSILGFTLTPVSISLLSLSANIFMLNKIIVYLNSLFSLSVGMLDKIIHFEPYSINYIIVAQKK